MSKDLSLLESLKENDSIALNVQVKDWQEAIIICTKKLVENGAIEKSYVDAIINSTIKNGPYYIINENVAMPHARPEDGVNKDAFALITLQKPVVFPKDKRKIQVLISLAATSSDIHVSTALPQIVAVFESKETTQKILSAKSSKEVLEIISQVDFRKYL